MMGGKMECEYGVWRSESVPESGMNGCATLAETNDIDAGFNASN
jgi:hypothetical protein